MSVVLLKTPNSGEAAESAVHFISVQHAKISITNGKVAERMLNHVEHEAMTWTVHRFKTVLAFVTHVDEEDVLFILVVVP